MPTPRRAFRMRGPKTGAPVRLLTILSLVVCAAGTALHAQPSPQPSPQPKATGYIPVTDPVYGDIDVLITSGVATGVFVGERPYSRAAIRRLVSEAERRLATGSHAVRVREALARLRDRVAPQPAPTLVPRDGAPQSRALSATPTSTAVALTTSEDRRMISGAKGEQIDATLNPMLQRNQGRVLLDAATLAVEGGALLERGHLAAEVSARAYGGTPRSGNATGDVQLVTGYGRAVAGPWGLDVGRVSRVTGFGAYGGAMLSDNARALTMVQLRPERPLALPGVLRHLGSWQPSAFIADLGQNRDQPGSALLHMRMAGKTLRFVEFGISYMNQHGGKGAPPSLQWQRLEDMFLFLLTRNDYEVTEKVAAADLRIGVPALRSAVYVNFLTTDDRGRFSQPAGGYWEDAIWLVGAERVGLGPDGRVDLRVEGRHTGAIPHTHHQFTSGITVDNRVLGDALGPTSSGLSVQGTYTSRDSRWRVELAGERYEGDRYYTIVLPDGGPWNWDWRHVPDQPDETRQRLLVDYLRFRGWRGYETSLRGGAERVTGFGYTTRGARWGLLAQFTLRALH